MAGVTNLNSKQIRPGSIDDSHIKALAAIAESKLDINWGARYRNALESKKVVDYVQATGITADGVNKIDLTALNIIPFNAVSVVSSSTNEGVITDAPLNKVVIRDVATGEPILDADGSEVYGRVTYVASPDGGVTPAKYELSFYSDADVAFTMPASSTIDFQYLERFNLYTVSELFAANEKFASGVADITTHQQLQQLAKDLYGAGWQLNRDGQAILGTSVKELVDAVKAEVEAARGTYADLDARLDVIDLAIATLEQELASTAAGEGASKIGVEAGSGLTGATVQDVLEDLESRMASQESGGGAEVTDTHSRDAASANGLFAERSGANSTTEFASLEERLVDIETVVDAQVTSLDGRADTLETEVQAARNSTALTGTEVTHASLDERLEATDAQVKATKDEVEAARTSSVKKEADGVTDKAFASVDERLEAAEQDHKDLADAVSTQNTANDTRFQTLEDQAHTHHRGRYVATGGETEILLSAFVDTGKAGLPAPQDNGSLELYWNGVLQEEGVQFAFTYDGAAQKFTLIQALENDGTNADIITLKYRFDQV